MKYTIIDNILAEHQKDGTNPAAPANLLCLSHLRWEFVYQRPQHLLSRFSSFTNVYFLEEPIFADGVEPSLLITGKMEKLWVCVPQLPHGLDQDEINWQIKRLMNILMAGKDLEDFTFWYYTPMALEFSNHLTPALTVYDCMDELAAFKFAPARIRMLEKQLFERADLVFTGGQTLFQAKKDLHPNIHAFPSSIDKKHFSNARNTLFQPHDQMKIPGPKIGFYGVIDERFDYNLIREIADTRPDWSIVLIGPIVKIDPAVLPTNSNIYYLGPKSYEELPLYLSAWNVAIVPFLINESTRFVSPTKTPEYLCGGKPVVSTPITDIIDPYGKQLLVSVADNPESFIMAIEYWMDCEEYDEWLEKVDQFLLGTSWDATCSEMAKLMHQTIASKNLHQLPQTTGLPATNHNGFKSAGSFG